MNKQAMKVFSKDMAQFFLSTRLISCVITLVPTVCFPCFNQPLMIFTAYSYVNKRLI